MQEVQESRFFNFPEEEEKILEFWESIDAFGQQLKQSEGKPEYVFFDGPPFATGMPHYGHLLAGTIKVRGLLHVYEIDILSGICLFSALDYIPTCLRRQPTERELRAYTYLLSQVISMIQCTALI